MSDTDSGTRRRGRPPIIPPEVEEELALAVPHVQTRRGLHNVHYRTRAEEVLADDHRCAWLTEGSANTTLLAELGRFEDPDEMRAVARAVCRARPRPKVRDAVAMIRRRRTGVAAPVDPQVLEAQLASVTATYLHAHPGVTWEQVRGAADEILEKFSDNLPEGEGGEARSARAIRRKMARLAGLRLRDVVGPVDQAELEAKAGAYLLVIEHGGRWRPLYAGNTDDVEERIGKLSPEEWFRRVPIRVAVAYTGDMPGDERQAVEDAVKEEFEIDT